MAISRKQRQILAFPYTKYDALIADGAIRSGKTTFMTVAFIDDAMRRYNGQRFGICGKTVDSAVKNIIMPFLAMTLPQEKYGIQWKRSDKLLVVTDGDIENYFEVFGGKDESSFTLIQGRTLAGVLLDEVALQPRSFVEQALARCSVAGSKLWFNCNPGPPSHWFHKEWVQHPEKHNAVRLHFELEDNPSLDEKIIARYKRMYTGVFYDRYIRGLWVAAEGLVYQQFADHTEDFLADRPPEPIMHAVIGVDFGGTKSGHAFQLVGFTRGYRHVVLLDEYYHDNKKGGRLSPKQLEDDFVDFVRRAQMRYRVTEVRADSAEQTLIEGLTVAAIRARLGVEIRNAVKGLINDRIAFYNSMMAQGRFVVLRHCKVTIDALSEAVYDPDETVKDVRLDDGTTNIDSLDALEYTTEPIQNQILYL